MPKKKTPPLTESAVEQSAADVHKTARKKTDNKENKSAVQAADSAVQEAPTPASPAAGKPIVENRWLLAAGIGAIGLLLGILLCYLLQVRPLQEQLILVTGRQNIGELSSNQIKSDLSNTRLRQQEMEIRYLTAAARLESANQYILLLRMKEQVTLAHLMVVNKEGLEARKALAEVRTLFDQLNPYIVDNDAGIAAELETILQTTVQDLTGDPESVISDLENLASHIDKVEAALFKME